MYTYFSIWSEYLIISRWKFWFWIYQLSFQTIFQCFFIYSMPLVSFHTSWKHQKTRHIVSLTMRQHLFLEFWLVHTWFFANWRHNRAVTHLENVRQWNIRRGKRLGFQLSHKHPLEEHNIQILYFTVLNKWYTLNFHLNSKTNF